MDDTLAQFRQAADLENQHRRARRRSSLGLRQQAIGKRSTNHVLTA